MLCISRLAIIATTIRLGDYTLKDFTDDLHSLEERSSSKLSVSYSESSVSFSLKL